MPKATARFRNIVKIEFIKAVLPFTDIFTYPFVSLTVDELDTNNFGTNDRIDNAFAILQYDANWKSNENYYGSQTGGGGFTSFIPKHMKCQRVYSPTPLASLSKLTLRLQRPDGNLIHSGSDTLDIRAIYLSDNVPPSITTNNASVQFPNGEYIFINTTTWFNGIDLQDGDTIVIRNLSNFTNPTLAQKEFLDYVQDVNGHKVVGTAYLLTPSNLQPGSNTLGYANFIVIKNRMNDPTTGAISLKPFGGAVNNNDCGCSLVDHVYTSGKLINYNRQTQLIFRIVTRDYDSTSLLRPDNL
jgi:hypothetical protein